MPSHLTTSLDCSTSPFGRVSVATFASLEVVKWISSVLARSNWIADSEASLYSLSTSRSRIRMFFFRLDHTVEIEISSIYERNFTEAEVVVSKRFRI